MREALHRGTLLCCLLLALLLGVSCGTGIAGTYVNRDNSDEYLDLNPDGSFFLKEYLGFAGRYEVAGDTITIRLDSGLAARARIHKDGSIHDDDGKVWVKKE